MHIIKPRVVEQNALDSMIAQAGAILESAESLLRQGYPVNRLMEIANSLGYHLQHLRYHRSRGHMRRTTRHARRLQYDIARFEREGDKVA